MPRDSEDARRRHARTGALARVLAEAREAPQPVESQASPVLDVPARPERSKVRYFPTKGRATIPPEICRPWKYADRSETESTHAAEIAQSLLQEGQIQPVIVRCVDDSAAPDIRYEVVCGKVRWIAALSARTELDVDIRELDDHSAFRIMVAENERRRPLSDYAKAKRFKRAVDEGLYKSKGDLAQDFGLTSAQLSYLLAFADLDEDVVSAIADIGTVSARLGYVLSQAVKLGLKERLVSKLPEIESGSIHRDKIIETLQSMPNSSEAPKVREHQRVDQTAKPARYVGPRGVLFFSVKQAQDGLQVRFSKEITHLLDNVFWEDLREQLERRLGVEEVPGALSNQK